MALFSGVSYHESSVASPHIHTILGVTGIEQPAEDPLPWQLYCPENRFGETKQSGGLSFLGPPSAALGHVAPKSRPGHALRQPWNKCCFLPIKIGKGTGPPSPTKDRKKDVSSPQRGQSSPLRRNSRSERR